jgi:enoyl-CoA hydratase
MTEHAEVAPTGGDGVVLVEHHDRVSVLVLNRPAVRNAINATLAGELVTAVAACHDAGCIVITGADPAFCAGLDLRDVGVERLVDMPPFLEAVSDSSVPTIAAVNGAAVTGGLELALACDFIVASARASFADTHLRVGVYPGPVLVDLPRRVGMPMAREMSLTGNFVDAEQALRIGLANHVVPHDDLLPFALELASAIAECDPRMVATMRRDWDETAALGRGDALRRHHEIGRDAGYRGVTSDRLSANMSAVVARAHRKTGRPEVTG